jgi:hypothetical protein
MQTMERSMVLASIRAFNFFKVDGPSDWQGCRLLKKRGSSWSPEAPILSTEKLMNHSKFAGITMVGEESRS